jgi:hypothetical protein
MKRRRASTLKPSQCHPITGRRLSPVEIERADRLHRKFLSADQSLAAGRPLKKVFGEYSWYWCQRTYHSDRTRKVRFGYSTLVTLYYQWIKAGRAKKCLYRRWRSVTPRVVTAAFLLDFMKFCAVQRTLSLLATWKEFVASRKTPPPVTYSTILRYFNSRLYRRIQQALRTGKPIKGFLATARRSIQAVFAVKGGRTL